MYDVAAGWALRKDVHCRNLRWTVTDTCSSPDQVWLAYATINPTVHLVRAAALPPVVPPLLSLPPSSLFSLFLLRLSFSSLRSLLVPHPCSPALVGARRRLAQSRSRGVATIAKQSRAPCVCGT